MGSYWQGGLAVNQFAEGSNPSKGAKIKIVLASWLRISYIVRMKKTRPLTLKQTRVIANDSLPAGQHKGRRLNSYPLPICESGWSYKTETVLASCLRIVYIKRMKCLGSSVGRAAV